jgi:hypothetical protein
MNVYRHVFHHVIYELTPLCLLTTALLAAGFFALPHAAYAQEEAPWWPHPIWGSDDQTGASNWITPENVMQSLSVVQTGKVYELGFMYHRDMPLIGSRTYQLSLPSTAGPFGESGMMAHGEKLTADIGQIGTQFDGLGHIGKRITDKSGEDRDVFYNGFTAEDVYAPDGLKRLGIEHVKSVIIRGILIDVAGYKATPTLPDGYVVTMDDVRNALIRQNIDESSIRPGDALLFNFGWWHIADEHERYTSFNRPGINDEVAQWIIEKKASMIGSDSSADPPGQYSVHFELLMKNGIYNLGFMTFESLLADEIHEFLFICRFAFREQRGLRAAR